jgi:hypothetical protein
VLEHPTLRRAHILARFGRLREAVAVVERALKAEPENEALRIELHSLQWRLAQERAPVRGSISQ